MSFALSLRRPLYVFALLFFACTALLIITGEAYAWCVAAIAGVVAVVVFCVPFLRRITFLGVAVCAVLLASVAMYARYLLSVLPCEEVAGSEITVTARVESVPDGDGRLYYVKILDDGGALPRGTKICAYFENDELLPEQADVVSGMLSVYPLRDTQKYLRGDGVFLYGGFSADTGITGRKTAWYEQLGSTLREKMLASVRETLPGDEGDLVAGICLGETSSLSDAVTERFRQSGLAHLIVVSGLHMTFLAGALLALFRLCRVPRKLAALLSLLPVWIFMLMVGFSPSVIRAAVMLHCVLLGDALELRADTRTSLSVALLWIVLGNPYAATDIGFLLSFAATLGLIVLSPVFNSAIHAVPGTQTHRWWHSLLQALGCPVAAMGFTAPVVAYAFGGISVLSPVSNLLAVWPSTFLLYFGMLGGVLSCVPYMGGLARIVLYLAGLVAKWILLVAEWISSLSVSWLHIRHTVILMLLILLPIAAVAAYRLLGRRGVRRVLATAMSLLVLCGSVLCILTYKTVSVRIASEENAFSAVFGYGNRTLAIISGEDRAACRAARYHLETCGVDRLDALVVTDGTPLTTATLADLLESAPADTVIYPVTKPDITAGISDIERQPFEDGVAFSLWDCVTVSMVGGWWCVEIGDTRVLFAPVAGDVDALPQQWRTPALAVLRGNVPKNVSILHPERVMLLCNEAHVSGLVNQLSWGAYAVDIAFQTGEMRAITTGDGKLSDAERLWI